MNSHQEFTEECLHKDLTPRGLRVKVRCNALLPTYSNVRDKFRETGELAERDFKSNLWNHYTTTRSKLTSELAEVEEAMTTALATPQEKDTHPPDHKG